MRLFLAVLLALTLGALAPATILALPMPHQHRQAKQQIEDLEQEWRAATLAVDIATMDRLLSDDYVGISWNGQVNTKTMQLDRLRTRTLAINRLDLSDTKIKVVGSSVAIVTARADLDGTNDGAEINGIFRYTRVYQRLPSGSWKITNFEVVRVPNPDAHRHRAASASLPQ